MDNEYEYGNEDTWHDSTVLDVETDRRGNVVAIWFRCQMIPFRQTVVDEARASEMTSHNEDLQLELHAVRLKVVNS